MILLQSDVIDFFESPWEPSASLRSTWEVGGREIGGGERKRELGLICNIKRLF